MLMPKRLLRTTMVHRCGYCEMDMDKPEDKGGCYCCKDKHTTYGKSSILKTGHTLDYIDGYYDGYGYYDAVRRNIDNEEYTRGTLSL